MNIYFPFVSLRCEKFKKVSANALPLGERIDWDIDVRRFQ